MKGRKRRASPAQAAPPPNHQAIRDLVELGVLLRQVRKASRLTQREAAGLLNVGRRFLIELERGKATASLGKTLQVLKGYGLDLIVARRGTRRPK